VLELQKVNQEELGFLGRLSSERFYLSE